ncbi:acyltransferase [Polymorphobacter fuscus]|uniref:Acyltransferase n=2 Tax=Sandarakinorhabdus fusca TaxID=1439888 RepID=A0A7C9KK92_9SPHN|nr:acyltransferase [Polymorphobacter fuscus]MQT18501.1 acyltransferase [Polymorphobacter fuscus]
MLRTWYVSVLGMTIGVDCRISRSAKLDRTNPRGVHIGDHTLISFDAAILTHDFVGGRHVDTFVGSNCFIGARSLIMPGVRIGNHCIIGSGSVVTSDIPDNCVAVGNPARILHRNIVTGRWGIRNPKFLVKEGIIAAPAADGFSAG